MISVRNILIGLAVAFTAYLAVRGLWWTEPVPHPYVVVATLGLFLVTTWLCVFWEPEGGEPAAPTNPADPTAISARGATTRLPVWGAVLALACAAIIPSAVAYGVGPDARTASFATWYLGGIGALMTIVMVRGDRGSPGAGIALLAVASMVWMQPLPALALGLVGAFLWVGVTQLLLGALDRAARDTAQLTELQRAASGWQAAQVVRQRERRVQIQRALDDRRPRAHAHRRRRGRAQRRRPRRSTARRGAVARRAARRPGFWTTRCATRSSVRVAAEPTSPCSTKADWKDSTRRR